MSGMSQHDPGQVTQCPPRAWEVPGGCPGAVQGASWAPGLLCLPNSISPGPGDLLFGRSIESATGSVCAHPTRRLPVPG